MFGVIEHVCDPEYPQGSWIRTYDLIEQENSQVSDCSSDPMTCHPLRGVSWSRSELMFRCRVAYPRTSG